AREREERRQHVHDVRGPERTGGAHARSRQDEKAVRAMGAVHPASLAAAVLGRCQATERRPRPRARQARPAVAVHQRELEHEVGRALDEGPRVELLAPPYALDHRAPRLVAPGGERGGDALARRRVRAGRDHPLGLAAAEVQPHARVVVELLGVGDGAAPVDAGEAVQAFQAARRRRRAAWKRQKWCATVSDSPNTTMSASQRSRASSHAASFVRRATPSSSRASARACQPGPVVTSWKSANGTRPTARWMSRYSARGW